METSALAVSSPLLAWLATLDRVCGFFKKNEYERDMKDRLPPRLPEKEKEDFFRKRTDQLHALRAGQEAESESVSPSYWDSKPSLVCAYLVLFVMTTCLLGIHRLGT